MTHCAACLRSNDEIMKWGLLQKEGRRDILCALRERRFAGA